MSTLSGLNGSVRSIQTAYVDTAPTGTLGGTSGEASYLDITISSVTPAKCIVVLDCVFSNVPYAVLNGSEGYPSYQVTGRLTDATTLRLGAGRNISGHNFYGRYQIIEFY